MFFSPPLKDGRNLDWLRDTMSTSCCSLKGNKIPNQILVWIKGSLRLSVLNYKEAALHDDFTPIDTHCWAYTQ